MSMTDPIADLLTRIRNASKARKPAVDIPLSGFKREIVRILKEESYVRDYIELPDTKQGILRVYLRYSAGDMPVIRGIQRISRPGLRQYWDVEKVKSSTHHIRGMSVLSTSKGVMTNFAAAKNNVGGEVVMKCW